MSRKTLSFATALSLVMLSAATLRGAPDLALAVPSSTTGGGCPTCRSAGDSGGTRCPATASEAVVQEREARPRSAAVSDPGVCPAAGSSLRIGPLDRHQTGGVALTLRLSDEPLSCPAEVSRDAIAAKWVECLYFAICCAAGDNNCCNLYVENCGDGIAV